MNWSENMSHENITSSVNGIEDGQSEHKTNSLFAGDTGELSLDTRRALVQLLSGPSLDERRHSKLWSVLLRDEDIIRRRLADLFLELVLDRDLQVAFTRQADTGDLEAPKVLRRAQLTFMDSILLLYLRRQLTQAESHAERAVVSKTEIVEHLSLYEKAGNTDKAGFAKRVHASIEKIKKHNILQKIRTSNDRFEVSPTLKLLFSAEEIQALTTLYQRMAADELQTGNDQTPREEGEKE
ncbi:MAG: DUF4194 domain-containing protein [Treponema sp.]|jgi:hypothetical protein|nr:DUF4194 domain-containing protein [Treponema sp.]